MAYASAADVETLAGRYRHVFGYVPATSWQVDWRGLPWAMPEIYETLYSLEFSPGTVALKTTRPRLSDEVNDWRHSRRLDGSSSKAMGGNLPRERGPSTRGVVREWSPKSRTRMVRTVASIDYSEWAEDGGVLAMVTLTLPGDWLAVAPSGKDFKRLVETFRRRWQRSGLIWRCLWKLEFQERGAPHLHMLARVPAMVGDRRFEHWLSDTWADVCAADEEWCHRCKWPALYCPCDLPDTERQRHRLAGTRVDLSGIRFSDPRRTAVYFLKHSAKTTDNKEYQHVVPEAWQSDDTAPGRFWGYAGLSKATATVRLHRDDFYRARRIARKVRAAAESRTELARRRARGESVWTMRKPRTAMRSGGGWVVVNDAVGFAYDLARFLALYPTPPPSEPFTRRGGRSEPYVPDGRQLRLFD